MNVTATGSFSASAIPTPHTTDLINHSQFGASTIEPFQRTWLEDYLNVLIHLITEHKLHVKGVEQHLVKFPEDTENRAPGTSACGGEAISHRPTSFVLNQGMTWHVEKFKASGMDPRLNPEENIQLKLGYFLIPEEMLNLYEAELNPRLNRDLFVERDGKRYVRFFVHPEGYRHYASLFETDEILYVSPKDSNYLGTPTSSYRSWAVRAVKYEESQASYHPLEGSVPFIVKVGVEGSVLGSDRWLSNNEVERSIGCQRAFNTMGPQAYNNSRPGGLFRVFAESFGVALKVPGYPAAPYTKPSGMIIREFPAELLRGEHHIFSMAALMSIEETRSEGKLPLIFDSIQNAIDHGTVSNTGEYVEKYLIDGYLSAIEEVTFNENMTLEPHSQNLCMIFDSRLIPIGYAYRDHGGIWVDLATRAAKGLSLDPFTRSNTPKKIFKAEGALGKGYLQSYAWFYRYQVFCKIQCLLVKTQRNYWNLPEAPVQIGNPYERERLLYPYIKNQVSKLPASSRKTRQLMQLRRNTFCMKCAESSLHKLEKKYIALLTKHFYMDHILRALDLTEGKKQFLPAVEGGSEADEIYKKQPGFMGVSKATQTPVKESSRPALRPLDGMLSRTPVSPKTPKAAEEKENVPLTQAAMLGEEEPELVGLFSGDETSSLSPVPSMKKTASLKSPVYEITDEERRMINEEFDIIGLADGMKMSPGTVSSYSPTPDGARLFWRECEVGYAIRPTAQKPKPVRPKGK